MGIKIIFHHIVSLKIQVLTLFCGIIAILVTGCITDFGAKDPRALKKHKVYILKNVSSHEKMINEQIRNGLKDAANDLGGDWRFEFSEPLLNFEQMRITLKRFIKDKPDCIISADKMFEPLIEDASQQEPNIKFALIESDIASHGKNVTSYLFKETECGLTLGFFAAELSQKHKIVLVSGMRDKESIAREESFLIGVDSSEYETEEVVEYLGVTPESYNFADYAFSVADKYYAKGFDVVAQTAGDASRGIFDAAIKNQGNVLGFGVDQSYDVGEFSRKIFVTSILKRYDILAYQALFNYYNTKFDPSKFKLGFNFNAIDVVSNAKTAPIIPKFEKLKDKVKTKQIYLHDRSEKEQSTLEQMQ